VDDANRRLVRVAGDLSVAQVPDLLEACADSLPVQLNLTDVVSVDVVAIEALQQLRSKGALLIGARRYLQLKLGLVNAAAPMGGQSLRELRRSARSLLAQRCRARSRHCTSRPLSTQRQCKLSRCHYRTSGKRSSEGLFLRQSLLG